LSPCPEIQSDSPSRASIDIYAQTATFSGCPRDQIENFLAAGVILQDRQLAASAAARLCDNPSGPTAIGYGGARGGGKSHWLLAQMGADDCQRIPGLKCLLLRKVGKSNLENFEDLRRRIFRRLPHDFTVTRGILTFENGSRIIAGHFKSESDIDAYLGLEYDVIGVEEATTLTARKYQDITTCCRTSKTLANGQTWRPRLYSTTNPGGIGHAWYRNRFITPYQTKTETETRFIPAKVGDNRFHNPEYAKVLARLTGWQRRAWCDGDWDISIGQFFTNFRREIHVIDNFDETRAVEWVAALDYGFTHYTVVLLGCRDGDGNLFIVDEHAERMWLPQRHADAIKAMLARHKLALSVTNHEPPRSAHGFCLGIQTVYQSSGNNSSSRRLARFVAGLDVFSKQSDGTTVASQYAAQGITLRAANSDRINGWAEILGRLGDPSAGIHPRLFIHSRCARLIECLPNLQHDPNRPEDVLKVDPDDDGQGGDDAADALRYLVATKIAHSAVRRLVGL